MFYLSYKTSYLNEEVNCTEPSLSVRLPCSTINMIKIVNDDFGGINYDHGSVTLCYQTFFPSPCSSINKRTNSLYQGALAEGEGSVQLN